MAVIALAYQGDGRTAPSVVCQSVCCGGPPGGRWPNAAGSC